MQRKKILYFINGPFPSDDQMAKAEQIGAVFRNARNVKPDDKPEKCDAVCGKVIPKQYKDIERARLNDPDATPELIPGGEVSTTPPTDDAAN